MNCFTVDLEDWFNFEFGGFSLPRDKWDSMPSRIEHGTDRLLSLLESAGVPATFFVLGWVARQYPELVRRVAGEGHEIGCHTMWHRRVDRQTPREFREDLREARQILEDVVGVQIDLFRAPGFSVTAGMDWFFEILAEEGIRYDSSIFPGLRAEGGDQGARRAPHVVSTRCGPVHEFPVTVVQLLGKRVSLFGGGYFRLAPVSVVVAAARRLNARNLPVMFYIHPHDLDPQQPRVAKGAVSKFRRYYGLGRTEAKLRRLTGSLKFGRFKEIVEQAFRSGKAEQ